MKIGIPRALYYYDFYPFWTGFFHKLGLKTVVSPKTNRKIMEEGLKKGSDDTCLPIKILVGHLHALKDVDAIFLPRIVSMEEKTYLCPKFLGLPESVVTTKNTPQIPILSVNVNWRGGKRNVQKEIEHFANQLGYSAVEGREALKEAERWQQEYTRLRVKGVDFQEAINMFETIKGLAPAAQFPSSQIAKCEIDSAKPTIALVGHPYLTYESFANLNLLKKLREKANLKMIEDVEGSKSEGALAKLRKGMFWSHGKRILGAGFSFVDDKTIDGIIYLSCFGCGTDSITQDMVAREARTVHKPYMVITLDEHSGEAGLVTRLEAYIDMLERRITSESNISAHG